MIWMELFRLFSYDNATPIARLTVDPATNLVTESRPRYGKEFRFLETKSVKTYRWNFNLRLSLVPLARDPLVFRHLFREIAHNTIFSFDCTYTMQKFK